MYCVCVYIMIFDIYVHIHKHVFYICFYLHIKDEQTVNLFLSCRDFSATLSPDFVFSESFEAFTQLIHSKTQNQQVAVFESLNHSFV